MGRSGGGGFSGGGGGGGGFSGGPGMGGGSRGGGGGFSGGGGGGGFSGGPGMGGMGGSGRSGGGSGMGGPGMGSSGRPGGSPGRPPGGPGRPVGGPGMGGPGMRRRRPPRRRRGIGWLGTAMFPVLIVVFVIVIIIGSVVAVRSSRNSYSYDDYGYSYDYGSENVNRTKLESDLCIESSQWIDDELGWIYSESTVRKSMDEFYRKTGVQPYLIITDNIDGKGSDVTDDEVRSYMEDTYAALYGDQGHMILLLEQYSDYGYNRYIYVGASAKSVIDTTAQNLILNYVDRYYSDQRLSNDEFLSEVFTESADALMPNHRARNIGIIILVIGAVLIVVLIAARQLAIARTKKAEATQRILDTPIGESPENEDLLKKYGDDSDDGSS